MAGDADDIEASRALVLALLLSPLLASCGGGGPGSGPTTVENIAPATQPGGRAQEPGMAYSVERTSRGGVLELGGDHTRAMTSAADVMAKHCGEGAYAITQESEHAVTGPQGPLTRWRVHYECTGNAASP